jgi:hypothetical protein
LKNMNTQQILTNHNFVLKAWIFEVRTCWRVEWSNSTNVPHQRSAKLI